MTIESFLNSNIINYKTELTMYKDSLNISIRESFDDDYFTKKSATPHSPLKGKFESLALHYTHNLSMLDIYNTLKSIAQDNILLITNWDVPFPKEKHYEIIKKHIVNSYPSYPYKDEGVDNAGNYNRYKVYYHIVNESSFNNNKERLNAFLEQYFKGFDNYSGYIIKPERFNQFSNYIAGINTVSKDEFSDSVRGFFSGVHDCETLLVVLK